MGVSRFFYTSDPWSKVLTFEKTQNSFGFLLTFSYLCSSVTTSLETPLRKGLIINRGNLQRIARPCQTNCTPMPNRWHGRAIHLARTGVPRRGGTSFPSTRHLSPCETAPSPLPSGTSLPVNHCGRANDTLNQKALSYLIKCSEVLALQWVLRRRRSLATLEVIGINEVIDDTFCDGFQCCFIACNYCR